MTFSSSDIDLIDQHLDLLKHSASWIHLANARIELHNQADNDLAPLPLSRYYRPRPTPYYRPPKSPRGAPRPKVEAPLSPVYALSPEYTPTSPTPPQPDPLPIQPPTIPVKLIPPPPNRRQGSQSPSRPWCAVSRRRGPPGHLFRRRAGIDLGFETGSTTGEKKGTTLKYDL